MVNVYALCFINRKVHFTTADKIFALILQDPCHNTFIGGTHIDAAKNLTAELPIEAIPAPEKVVLPLSMHIGAPAKPLVQPGEKVYLGQKIAEAQGAVSSNIHASVSGMVVGSERRFLPNGTVAACMVIKNDGQDTLDPTITPRESGLVLPPDEIRQLLAEKGIVGMGGATFPTHVKYAPQSSGRIIDTVILNGIECEPFITADYRILIEHADEVIRGLKYFLKASLANKGIIAIEDNKPRAIELLISLLLTILISASLSVPKISSGQRTPSDLCRYRPRCPRESSALGCWRDRR